MMWRPYYWKNLYDHYDHPSYSSTTRDRLIGKHTAFEAGADAMLEALKKNSPIMTPRQMELIAPDRKYPYGWLVFIPDEENKE